MTKYEDLIVLAENLGAEVREIDFGTDKKCGRCLDNLIYINSRISETEKYEVLAEEIGHFKTTHGNILNLNTPANRILENRARREGFKLIVKPDDLIKVIKSGVDDIYEIAEHFNVSITTLLEKIEDFKNGGYFNEYSNIFS